jgi:uncharacterized delta-60 repeat protein
MINLLRWYLLALLATLALPATAQTLDPTFAPTMLTDPAGFTIRALVPQPDGKVIVGGGYDLVDGVLTSKVRRLNADGSPDAAFLAQTGTGPDHGIVYALALQPNGKIIVGGTTMTAYNGTPAGGIARLNADGSVDASFNASGTGLSYDNNQNAGIRSLAVQPDGKILVGGGYSYAQYYNGQAFYGLLRLNPDGSIDSGFNLGSGLAVSSGVVEVHTILVQTDGKIVVGGRFDTYNGVPAMNLVRLQPNGSIDPSFAIGTGTSSAYYNNSIRTLAQQADGKLLLGGYFPEFNGTPVRNPIRLNPDGSLDNSFQGGINTATATGAVVLHLRLRPDGSILMAGNFTEYNGTPVGSIARLSSTGVLDATFISGNGATGGQVQDIVELPNGQYLAGGIFTAYNRVARTGLARLSNTAALDVTYNPVHRFKGSLYSLAPLANGQMLTLGSFNTFNGTAATPSVQGYSLARLNADGSYNSTVNITTNADSPDLQPDGHTYLNNYTYTGTTITRALTRILPSGTPDASFATVTVAGISPAYSWLTLSSTTAGAVFVGGSFTTVNGVARPGLARVLATGALDASFNPINLWPPTSAVNHVKAMALASGKVMVTWYDSNRSYLVMLTASGSLDPSFNIGNAAGPNGLFDVITQPDGRLLVACSEAFATVGAGAFTSFNGYPTPNGLLRLLPSGAPDPGFTAALPLTRLLMQPDGRILGTQNARLPGNRLRRLNADGSLDASFAAVPVPESIYTGLNYLLQPSDGKILLYGSFTSVNGQTRIGLARLTNTLLATRPAFAAAPELEVYPNPAQRQVSLRLPATAASATAQPVELLDMQGRLVRCFHLPARQTQVTFPLANLAPGLYLLQTTTRQGTARQRVVVTN